MSFVYSPLDRSRNEIRVIKIEPQLNYSASGRAENPWEVNIVNVDKSYDATKGNLSAVRLNPMEGVIHCTLEHVSLDDVTDLYRSYRIAAIDDSEWPEYLLSHNPTQPGPDNSQIPPWLACHLGFQTHSRHQTSNIIHLPTWRAPKWGSETYLSKQRLEVLEEATYYTPRYKWGDFEALSYTWGSDELKGKLVINGKLIEVGKNLEAALHLLRALPETKYGIRYWIDALCINQEDKSECDHEVKRMGDLYSLAASVIAWLGPSEDHSDDACDLICSLTYKMSVPVWRTHPSQCAYILEIEPLYQLLQRPYWQRLWIIQELALNHKNTTFICGNKLFFRQELDVALDCITCTVQYYSSLAIKEPLTLDWWPVVEHIRKLTSFDASTELSIGLNTILDLSQRGKCRDPRDKVYGMLGLLPRKLVSLIKPRHECTVEEVLEDFACKIAQLKGLDSLLSWAGQVKPMSLPSWSIDLMNPFPRNHVQWLRKRCATGYERPKYDFPGGGKLVCQAVLFDKINSLTETVLTADDLTSSSYLHVAEATQPIPTAANIEGPLMRELAITLLLGHPMKSDIAGSVLEIPWARRMKPGSTAHESFEADIAKEIANSDIFWEKIETSPLFPAFEKFRKGNTSFQIGGQRLENFFPPLWPRLQIPPPSPPFLTFEINGQQQSVRLAGPLGRSKTISAKIAFDMKLAVVSLVGRRLAVTASGCLSLVPEAAQIGDAIAIVDCPFPIVLRPLEEEFSFVGECFVNGIMDGEALSNDDQQFVEVVIR